MVRDGLINRGTIMNAGKLNRLRALLAEYKAAADKAAADKVAAVDIVPAVPA
jgi:hypothetical protein